MLGNQANNNEITDLVRGKISTLPIEDQIIIAKRLEQILEDCYFDVTPDLDKLSDEELFYLKESLSLIHI